MGWHYLSKHKVGTTQTHPTPPPTPPPPINFKSITKDSGVINGGDIAFDREEITLQAPQVISTDNIMSNEPDTNSIDIVQVK